MKAKATSFDIAYFAGVSQSTVSRALRNSPLVSTATRQRIQQIAKKLNYKVDKNASNLRSQQSQTLALLLFEEAGAGDCNINPFFLSMLGSITRACSDQGYDLLVSFQQASHDWHADYEDCHRADGLILLGYGDHVRYQHKMQRLLDANTHFICWGAKVPDHPELSICCDNYSGGQLAARFLTKKRYKKCVFLGDASEHYPEFFARFKGFESGLAESGTSIFGQYSANSSEQEGYHAAKAMLDRVSGEYDLPDAIFAASDLIAIGAIRALQEKSIEIPTQVAILGFDDIDAARYANPALTTIKQNTAKAGHLLVARLLKQIAGETVSPIDLQPELVVRESA